MSHVDEWAQGAREQGPEASAVAGIQRACEEIIRRGPNLSKCSYCEALGSWRRLRGKGAASHPSLG